MCGPASGATFFKVARGRVVTGSPEKNYTSVQRKLEIRRRTYDPDVGAEGRPEGRTASRGAGPGVPLRSRTHLKQKPTLEHCRLAKEVENLTHGACVKMTGKGWCTAFCSACQTIPSSLLCPV